MTYNYNENYNLTSEVYANGQSIRYEYDEWGSVASILAMHDEDAETQLANMNPLRYRGYYYDSETGYYYLQSRYYNPEICRFINADLPEYAQIQKDEYAGINSFVYCCNDSVNNSDPSGLVSFKLVYIFYDPDDFYRQAKDEQKYWKEKINNALVQTISINSRINFINSWNKRIKQNAIVVWMFHGGPYHIRTTSDDFTKQHVNKLKNFTVKELYIYACNCGHLDVKDNIANRLKKHLTKTKKIYAMDGSISYYKTGHNFNYKYYKPRLSTNQKAYYKYASTKSYRDANYVTHFYLRPPTGLHKV